MRISSLSVAFLLLAVTVHANDSRHGAAAMADVAPRENVTTVDSLEGHGFTVRWVRGGVRVIASSLDGNGAFECTELVVTSQRINWFDADASILESAGIVRREFSYENDHTFDLTHEEITRSMLIITYSGERADDGADTVNIFYCATELLLTKTAG
jgi:hypothetical protein